jgi:hypothetical protein
LQLGIRFFWQKKISIFFEFKGLKKKIQNKSSIWIKGILKSSCPRFRNSTYPTLQTTILWNEITKTYRSSTCTWINFQIHSNQKPFQMNFRFKWVILSFCEAFGGVFWKGVIQCR